MAVAFADQLKKNIIANPLNSRKDLIAYNDINIFLRGNNKQDFRWLITLLPKEKRTDELSRMIGRMLMIHGNKKEAISYLTESLEQFPDYSPIGTDLAECYVHEAMGNKKSPKWQAAAM